MSSDSKAAAQKRRQKARAIVERERRRSQHVTDLWHATMRRQADELKAFADDVVSDEPPKAGKVVGDLFALWVGFQADACDLLHETFTHCLNDDDDQPDTPAPGGGTTPRVQTLADVEFRIEAVAEAADPQRVAVAYADRGRLRARELARTQSGQAPAPPRIPGRNVRVTTYGTNVFLSLVNLGRLDLVSGAVYEGPLELDGQQIATIRVRVI